MRSYLSQGVYSPVDAARLTGIAPRRVRRWFEGYSIRHGESIRTHPPVLPPDEREVDGRLQLTFLDLIEIRLIDAFLREGVPWKELRHAAKQAAAQWKTAHPFASCRFKTDGRRLFSETENSEDGSQVVHVAARQQFFKSVIGPLLRDVEFDGRQAIRWWPIGERNRIVIDPEICFGKPVGSRSGVPAEILATYATRHGVRGACRWYEVDEIEVKGALRLAKRQAA
jgi:hypothetical protein